MTDEAARQRATINAQQAMRRRRILAGVQMVSAAAGLLLLVLGVALLSSGTLGMLWCTAVIGGFLWFASERGGPADRLAARIERWLSSAP